MTSTSSPLEPTVTSRATRQLFKGTLSLALALASSVTGTEQAAAQANASTSKTATREVKLDEDLALDLALGESRTISASNVKNYSEGAAGFIDVRITSDGSQFVVTGTKPGSTTLLLISKDGTRTSYNVNVFARSPHSVESELKQLVRGNVGIRLRKIGARFFIEGGVSTEADVRRFQRIAALYPGQVESLVELGSIAEDRAFNIRIDYYFIQFNRNSGYALGVNWPGRVGGEFIQNSVQVDLLTSRVNSATATISNQPLPALDIASGKGWARVLKQATVITGNGSEAKFASGGEQNFMVATSMAANIQAIQFGVDLTVLPRYDRSSGEMEIKLQAENNDLAAPGSGSTLPGRSNSKLSTIVHLRLGQSIILSGINTKSQTHSVSGLPLLSEIPVLGVLFGSHRDEAQDLEGAVFLIPSVIESLPKATLDTVNAALSQYESFSGDMSAINAFNKRPPVTERPAKKQ
jgi:pilus assembly protein CpaC